MEYRVTLKSNPRLFILFFIIGTIPALGVLAIVFWSPVAGAILLAVGGYIDYHLVKFARLQLKSYVRTDENGIHGLSSVSETVDISWDNVTHAGTAEEDGNKTAAFVYDETNDQLIVVPSEYANFEAFVSELDQRFDTMRFELAQGETVNDKLREHLEFED
jgi:hypothetical protein